ncbi:MAG TPA: ABC transporter ATP-binding protein [Naasia sp.]
MASSAAPAVRTSGLIKRFGRATALGGLDLEVLPGEVHGFLGPNGAGKSTTIRILLGLVRATSGSAEVFGLDPWREAPALHRRIAYVPGDVSLWPGLSGGETIDLLTSLRGGADTDLRRRLIADFDLDVRKRARTYSKGNRQKVALVAALARRADLYVLDEPTSGLDPVMEAVFRTHVERVRREGAGVLLSSHILSEVELLCDRVTIIRAGVAVETGTLAMLRHLTRTTVRLSADRPATALGFLAGVHDLVDDGGSVRFDVDSAALPDVLPRIAELRPSALTVTPPTLEELFLHHYEEVGR